MVTAGIDFPKKTISSSTRFIKDKSIVYLDGNRIEITESIFLRKSIPRLINDDYKCFNKRKFYTSVYN